MSVFGLLLLLVNLFQVAWGVGCDVDCFFVASTLLSGFFIRGGNGVNTCLDTGTLLCVVGAFDTVEGALVGANSPTSLAILLFSFLAPEGL